MQDIVNARYAADSARSVGNSFDERLRRAMRATYRKGKPEAEAEQFTYALLGVWILATVGERRRLLSAPEDADVLRIWSEVKEERARMLENWAKTKANPPGDTTSTQTQSDVTSPTT